VGAIGFPTALCSAAGALFYEWRGLRRRCMQRPYCGLSAICRAEGAKPPAWQNKKIM